MKSKANSVCDNHNILQRQVIILVVQSSYQTLHGSTQ